MKKILLFNTVFSELNIILQNGGNIISDEIFSGQKQSEILVGSIKSILDKNNLGYRDIDVFSTISGPGNFTGIKTGLAVLKALKMSTNKNIMLVSVFDIISHGQGQVDLVLVDMGTAKYYIKDADNSYYTIYRNGIGEFLNSQKNRKILTNDLSIAGDNIIHSKFTNEKLVDLVSQMVENNNYSQEILPLYIEDATVTKRKK